MTFPIRIRAPIADANSGTAGNAPLRSNAACRPQANASLCPSANSISSRSTKSRRAFNSGR